MEFQPFEKTELFFRGIEIKEANLDHVAEAVARALDLNSSEVIVVDARDDLLTVDLLGKSVRVDSIVGAKHKLLAALGRVEGVRLTEESHVHSEGVLGLVNVEQEKARALQDALKSMGKELRETIAKRVLVLPTGDEVIAGEIQDTNTPFLCELFASAGYEVVSGEALEDDLDATIGALQDAVMQGYGLVVTTGGTGAEHKDCLVEAILALDQDAATPYVVYYQVGQGRHSKDGVRLAVGKMDLTVFVALTGPHQEVRLVAPTLIKGLKLGWDKAKLAESMASILREMLLRESSYKT